MRQRLNDLTIRKLRTGAVQTDVWDTSLPCFGVRISRRGTKTFILKQRNKRYTLGRYPFVTLKQAREEAHRRIALKYLPQNSLPAQQLIDLYLEARRSELRQASFYGAEYHLRRSFPAVSISAVTAPALYEAIRPLTPSQQNQAFSFFKTFLNWCVERQYISVNPIANTKTPNKRRSRSRLLTDPEIRTIWIESHKHNSFGAIVRLLILTGQRLNQIARLQQPWLHADTFVFPPDAMKSKGQHTIPLTAHARAELPTTTSPFLLANTTGQPFLSVSSPMKALREALPPFPHWTLHDIRHYFSSTMAKLKVPIDVTEAILDHKTGSRTPIQRVYDHFNRLDPMREALEHYEQHLFATVLAEQT
jgi:integrase